MDMDKRLSGKTVAILVANGFDELDMTGTQRALAAEGAAPKIVSPEVGLTNGWHEGTWGHNFYVEVKPKDVLPSQYDALLVPGGDRSLKGLSENAHARRILKGMIEAGKPVGVITHAVELLAAADAIAGRTVTGLPQSQEAVTAAGGRWSDEPVTVDENLITTVGGASLQDFIQVFLDRIEAGESREREAA